MRLLVCGSNSSGQLGLGHTHDLSQLTCAVSSSSGTSFPPSGWAVSHLSAGANHTVAILSGPEGTRRQAWCAGTSASGQLGPRGDTASFTPLDLEVEMDEEPTLVACGWNCTYLLLRASRGDRLISLGLAEHNAFGELGVLDPKGGVHTIPLPQGARVEKLAAGLRHGVALISLEDEVQLLGWGSARHGQIGDIPPRPARTRPGPPPSPVVAQPQLMRVWSRSQNARLDLAAGKEHTIALVDGKPFAFGSNRLGQCTLPDGEARAVSCNWNGSVYLLADGRAVGYGSNNKGQLAIPSERVGSIAAGSEHTLFCTASSTLGTGWNEHGNLARSNLEDVHSPILLWPHPAQMWAGCGTTFLQIDDEHVG